MSHSLAALWTSPDESDSKLFRVAHLQSERIRVIGFLILLLILLSVTTVRTFVLHTGGTLQEWLLKIILLFALALHEFFMLRRIQRAMGLQSSVPNTLWILNTCIEGMLAALAIVLFANQMIPEPYRPLVNPAFPIFFLVITLSTLQLERAVSWLSGGVAGISYLAAALYLGWRPAGFGSGASPSAETTVPAYALGLVLAGLVAGFVAERIKGHVHQAVREVETRRELDRVRHDLEVARSIQQSLLPRGKPDIAGFDIAGWNRPADETGGDYFDWNVLSDGRLAVMLTDITGHGIGPALLAALCRAYARSAFETNKSMSAAVARLSRDLGEDLRPNRFATFASVLCRPGLSDVELLSAGHGPIVLYSQRAHSCRELPAQGLPLGIMPEIPYEPPAVVCLEPGDLILIATDGFVEWENADGEPFGVERLQTTIQKVAQLTPEQIIAKLVEDVAAFTGGTRQEDDLTAVIIKKTTPTLQ
jgi:serine phosphatase RsbU (regulator of sigma subunit)